MSVESPIRAADHFFAGEDKTLRFTVVDSAGAAVDISGWLVEFVMRPDAEATATFTKIVGSGITLTTPASGILDVAIADADTDTLTPGAYVYVLRRTTDTLEQVLAFGDVQLRPKVGT